MASVYGTVGVPPVGLTPGRAVLSFGATNARPTTRVALPPPADPPRVRPHAADPLYDPATLRRVRWRATPADREAFSKGFCHQINSSGTLVRVGAAFADDPFDKPTLCGDGGTVSTDRDTRKLGAGRKLDPLITGSPLARIYSVERTGQLLATHPPAGNWLEAALWKPGLREPLAVLKNDAPAMALLRRTPFGTVRECRSLFCVASMNLARRPREPERRSRRPRRGQSAAARRRASGREVPRRPGGHGPADGLARQPLGTGPAGPADDLQGARFGGAGLPGAV